MNYAEILQHVRHIQIQTRRQVEDLFAGIYRSAFKGKGLEFEDVREYQPGDDIRRIDWNVTARLQAPYIKNFREERELTVLLLVDISASSRFGSTQQLKSEIIAQIGALLAFSAIRNQDNVGLILFSDEIELYLSPKKGVRRVLRVIRELLFFQPQHRGTSINRALSFLGSVQHKRAICFLISDFLTNEDFTHAFNLAAKRHELIAIQVYDRYETQFPYLGWVHLKDLETHQLHFINTSDPAVQQQFEERAAQRQKDLKHTIEKAGAAWISIRTDESYTKALHRFFRLRGRVR